MLRPSTKASREVKLRRNERIVILRRSNEQTWLQFQTKGQSRIRQWRTIIVRQRRVARALACNVNPNNREMQRQNTERLRLMARIHKFALLLFNTKNNEAIPKTRRTSVQQQCETRSNYACVHFWASHRVEQVTSEPNFGHFQPSTSPTPSCIFQTPLRSSRSACSEGRARRALGRNLLS